MRTGEPLQGYRKICPVCGKEFWAFSDWKFSRREKTKEGTFRIYYCSWKCIRKQEGDGRQVKHDA